MKRQTVCIIISGIFHVSLLTGGIALCNRPLHEESKLVIDFSLEKEPIRPDLQKLSVPAKPKACFTRLPPSVPIAEAEATPPDTARADTTASIVAQTAPGRLDSAVHDSIPVIASVTATDAQKQPAENYIHQNFGKIHDRIYHNLAYPPEAVDNGWHGDLEVSFLIHRDGKVDSIRVLASSGYSILDKGAVEAVKRAAPFPASSQTVEVKFPVAYRLED